MKKFVFLVTLFYAFTIHAQTKFDPDSLFRTLPSLGALIDSALVFSPMIKTQDAEIAKAEFYLKISRNRWLNYVSIVGDAKYGTYDQLIINQNAVSGVAEGFYSNNVATRMQAGVSLKFSVYEMIKDKYDKKIALKNVEISNYKREEVEMYLRQTITKQYHEVLLNYKLMGIKMEFFQQAKLGRDFTEIDYKNNLVEYIEVSRACDSYQKALTDYETTKTSFITSILYLEYVVGQTLIK